MNLCKIKVWSVEINTKTKTLYFQEIMHQHKQKHRVANQGFTLENK